MASTRLKARHLLTYSISNYTNKHLTFHKGEYIGHLEPAVLDTTDQSEVHQTNSVTFKKMMFETVMPDPFNPPCHKLSTNVQNNLDLLLQEYESQVAQDETTTGTTPLTSIQ